MRSFGEKKRIIIAWTGFPDYAANVVDRFYERCISNGWSLMVYKFERACNTEFELRDPRFLCLGGSIENLKKIFMANCPDVFVFTSWDNSDFLKLAKYAKNRGAVSVCMVDNTFSCKIKQLAGMLYFPIQLRPLIDYCLVPGERAALFLSLLGMERSRILRGLYAANSRCFFLNEARAARCGKRLRYIFVGQLIERKGVLELCEFVRTYQDFATRMTIVGEGPLREQLENAGLRVDGFVQPSSLGELMRSHDCLLLPSKEDHWGVVAHEAAKCGLAVIATRQCGVVDDLVVHKKSGYVCRNSSFVELEKAIEWIESLPLSSLVDVKHMSRSLGDKVVDDCSFSRSLSFIVKKSEGLAQFI